MDTKTTKPKAGYSCQATECKEHKLTTDFDNSNLIEQKLINLTHQN